MTARFRDGLAGLINCLRLDFPALCGCMALDQCRHSGKNLMHAYRSHTCAALTLADVGAEVRLSGWVHRVRDHGGVLFIDLRPSRTNAYGARP